MLGAGAMGAQGFDVFRRAVAFVRGEAVVRVASVHLDEHPVAFDLRHDGGEGDGSGHAEGSQPRHGLEEKKKKMMKIIKIILGIL